MKANIIPVWKGTVEGGKIRLRNPKHAKTNEWADGIFRALFITLYSIYHNFLYF